MQGVEAGFSYVDRLSEIERNLMANGVEIDVDSPFYKLAQFF